MAWFTPTHSSSRRRGSSPFDRALVSLEESSVRSVELWRCELSDQAAVRLSAALELNSSVLALNLGENRVGDQGATRLAVALQSHGAIQSVYLFCNRIGDNGAEKLARVFEQHLTIMYVDLYGNHIRMRGALALLRAVERNTGIVWMNIQKNMLYDDAVRLEERVDARVNMNRAGTRVITVSLDLPQPSNSNFCRFTCRNMAGLVELRISVPLSCTVAELQGEVCFRLNHRGHMHLLWVDGTLLEEEEMVVGRLFALVSTFQQAC